MFIQHFVYDTYLSLRDFCKHEENYVTNTKFIQAYLNIVIYSTNIAWEGWEGLSVAAAHTFNIHMYAYFCANLKRLSYYEFMNALPLSFSLVHKCKNNLLL
uniref:Uncharacterized protein n=1 Tax=Ceratitis capitata TaxID=7213 RepID=W8B5X4_CERCA